MKVKTKARKNFVRAMVQFCGHYNNEFQTSKKREISKKVFDRNLKKVRETTYIYDDILEAEERAIKERLEEIKSIRYTLSSVRTARNPEYAWGIGDTFPEITKGFDNYTDRYYAKKTARLESISERIAFLEKFLQTPEVTA